jgi:PAS domain S-box-containing protein
MIELIDFLARLNDADLTSDGEQARLLGELRRMLGAASAALYLVVQAGEHRTVKKVLKSETALSAEEVGQTEAARVWHMLGQDSGSQPEIPSTWIPLTADGVAVGAIRLDWDQGAHPEADLARVFPSLGELIAQVFIRAEKFNQLKRAVEELHSSRQQLFHSRNTLRALFDSNPASIYIVDRSYTLAAVNMSRARLAGQPPQKLVGERCYTALFRRALPCPGCRVGETLANGIQTQRLERRWSKEAVTDLEISAYPIADEKGEVHQAFLFEEDVTERRRLEASLVHTEKLAAIGQLAAGVAHEINNPLTAIMANAELLLRSLSPEDREQREMAEIIVEAGKRASQSVRDLLDFSRREPDELAAADVNETIRRTVNLIRHDLQAHSITLTFDPEESLPLVAGSPDQLQSVWLNLLINAKQAIEPNPGEIHIATRRAGGDVQVTVTDNGAGIDPAQLDHLFEPFYTTKNAGYGTGLGLSVCHRIVTGCGGDIQVSSQPGAGTTFTVTLPVSK